MKSVIANVWPECSLLKMEAISFQSYLQIPRWLFTDPRYLELSVEAKLVYAFLVSRFQISQRKNWCNEYGEVFVYYPRANMAQDIHISEKRVTAAFRQLVKHKLIWEKRCGLGRPNEIYLVVVEPLSSVDPAESQTPEEEKQESVSVQEPPKKISGADQTGTCRRDGTEAVEHPNLRTNKKEKSKKEFSYHKSVSTVYDDREQKEEQELTEILDSCELSLFQPEEAGVMEQVIERLYYTDSLRIGNATLPQTRIRLRLRQLNELIVQEALRKLRRNPVEKIKNSIAYIMTVLFNTIGEMEGDLMIDPYLNGVMAS